MNSQSYTIPSLGSLLRHALASVAFLVFTIGVFAQSDRAIIASGLDTLSQEEIKKHSPAKASLFSAVLPGLGQAYNKKYWKMPLVYGLLGGTIYYAGVKTKTYAELKEAYIAKATGDFANVPIEYFTTTESDLNDLQQAARDNRDRSYLFVIAVYVLNIIDANVDAYLFNFDVSDDLSLQVHPYSDPSAQINYGVRLTLKL